MGIVLAEALACGTPVIAFGRGGAREILAEGQTGLLFAAQTPAAIIDAVARFEASRARFTQAACRAAALRYAPESFRAELQRAVAEARGAA